MYETPEVMELGDVSERTLGKWIGTWSDGIENRRTFEWVTEDLESEEI